MSYLQNRNRLTAFKKKLMPARGKVQEEGVVREFGVGMYTLWYLKWITDKALLYGMENSAHCYAGAWMGREFEGEWIHVYVWLSPFAVHLQLPQYC